MERVMKHRADEASSAELAKLGRHELAGWLAECLNTISGVECLVAELYAHLADGGNLDPGTGLLLKIMRDDLDGAWCALAAERWTVAEGGVR